MAVSVRPARRSLAGRAGVWLLVLALLAPVLPAGGVAAQSAPPLDLAAMLLTTRDLADIGLTGYAIVSSERLFRDEFAVAFANHLGRPLDEALAMLDEVGFLRAHYIWHDSPPEDGTVAQTIASYVIAFTDAESANAAWELFEDESQTEGAEDLPGFEGFGDRSEATLTFVEVDGDFPAHADLDATALTGELLVGISIMDWNEETPDAELAATLLELALERAEAERAAPQPALSNQIARLTGGAAEIYDDQYLLRDGVGLQSYGEDDETVANRATDAAAIGMVEEYMLSQFVAGSANGADQIWYFVNVYRFDSVEAAEGWIERRPDVLASFPSLVDIEFGEVAIGDGAFTYTAGGGLGMLPAYRGIVARFGELAFLVELAAPVSPSGAALEALAEAQLTCLEDGGCLDPFPIPPAVSDFITDVLPAN